MQISKITALISYVFIVLLTILILPHLPIYFRPNLILISCLMFSFGLGFSQSIWFWIIGGIILDSFIVSVFPINSVIFISLFVLILLLSKTFDYTTKMSQIVVSSILISIYYITWFIIEISFYKKQNYNFLIYLIETILLFIFIFKIKNKNNEKKFQKI